MNCKQCQDLILNQKTDAIQDHLKNCPECRDFLRTCELLFSLEPNLQECSNQFTLKKPSRLNKHPGLSRIRLPYAVPLAAAALLLVIYQLPWSVLLTTEHHQEPKAILLAQKISNEIGSLNETITQFEDDVFSKTNLVGYEIEELNKELNTLT